MTREELAETPFRLLVEGRDDLYTVAELMRTRGVKFDQPTLGVPFIDDCGGIAQLLDAFAIALKGEYQRLGLIVDANGSFHARFEQILSRLNDVGVPVDRQPSGGLLVKGVEPLSTIGVWIMPDNTRAGMLEDFLGELIPPSAPLWGYAGDVTTEAAKQTVGQGVPPFAKARLHTWLAWQPSPGLPFGTAIRSGSLDTESLPARRFAEWFLRTFPECALH